MESLPVEVLSMIFDQFVCLQDKLRLREVCKRFLWLVDGQEAKSLVIKEKFAPFRALWFHDHSIVHERNLIYYDEKVRILESKLFENRFFVNLKKLYLKFSHDLVSPDGYDNEKVVGKKQLVFLNNFQQLETLELDLLCTTCKSSWSEEPQIAAIMLKELKNLCVFSTTKWGNAPLVFDCPKLHYLSAWSLRGMLIRRPETVERVELVELNTEDLPKLSRFVNMKSFRATRKYAGVSLRALLSQSKQLQELHLPKPSKTAELNELKQFVKGRPVQVYVEDMAIDRWDESSLELTGNCLRFYLNNYPFTSGQFRSVTYLQYDDWQEFESIGLPANLECRLPYLAEIQAKEITSAKQFIEFLVKFRRILHLRVTNSSLNGEFYSRLPHYLPYLVSLCFTKAKEPIDFSFLLALKDFSSLNVDSQLDLSLLKQLIISKPKLSRIFFWFEGERIRIKPQVCLLSERHYYRSRFYNEIENGHLKKFEEEVNKEIDDGTRYPIVIHRRIEQNDPEQN